MNYKTKTNKHKHVEERPRMARPYVEQSLWEEVRIAAAKSRMTIETWLQKAIKEKIARDDQIYKTN